MVLFVKENGELLCYGDNSYGQHWVAPATLSTLSSRVQDPQHVSSVSCGWAHSLFITDTGELYACGWNQFGQCGTGISSISVSPPQRVELGPHWRPIQTAAGERHSLILAQKCDENQNIVSVLAMGSNEYGQCGVTSIPRPDERKSSLSKLLVLSPREVYPLPSAIGQIVKIACGALHSLLLTEAGCVFSFGWNGYRQLGHDDSEDRSIPTLIDTFDLNLTTTNRQESDDSSSDESLLSCTEVHVDDIVAGQFYSLFRAGSVVYGCGWAEWKSFQRLHARVSSEVNESHLIVECSYHTDNSVPLSSSSSSSSPLPTLSLGPYIKKEQWEIYTIPTLVRELRSFSVQKIYSGPLHWSVLGTDVSDDGSKRSSDTILVFGTPVSSMSNVSTKIEISKGYHDLNISFLCPTYWGLLIEYSVHKINK
jgi:hypothetical protein